MPLTSRRTEPVALLQRERALRPDLMLILPYLALSAVGVIMIYSASAPGLKLLGQNPASTATRHVLFVLVGVGVFLAASLISGRTLRSGSTFFYMGSVAALVLVPIAGRETNGAKRWIEIGPVQLQPSEFAKLAVILALAALLVNAGTRVAWPTLSRASLLVGVPALFVFLQPDLGTMLVFGFVSVVMVFVAGASARQVAFLAIGVAVLSVALLQVGAIKDYQIRRVTSFLDADGDNYNQRQSNIAIGSGGLFGKGLYEGTQTNLSFVPEQTTDFIFTAVGEQLGFVGGAFVLALYALIVWRLMVAAANGRERFSQLVAAGVAALLVFHVFVNVGMTMGMMPVTGLPLPFLSAGGTFFVSMSLGLGIAHSVWMRRSPVRDE